MSPRSLLKESSRFVLFFFLLQTKLNPKSYQSKASISQNASSRALLLGDAHRVKHTPHKGISPPNKLNNGWLTINRFLYSRTSRPLVCILHLQEEDTVRPTWSHMLFPWRECSGHGSLAISPIYHHPNP